MGGPDASRWPAEGRPPELTTVGTEEEAPPAPAPEGTSATGGGLPPPRGGCWPAIRVAGAPTTSANERPEPNTAQPEEAEEQSAEELEQAPEDTAPAEEERRRRSKDEHAVCLGHGSKLDHNHLNRRPRWAHGLSAA